MTAHPPPGYSAADTAAGVRAGELSASQIVKESLDRIRACQPLHNAFITIAEDDAATRAERIDARVACGEGVGALAGVPVAVKDVFAMAALPTTAGSALLSGRIAEADGPVVAALKRSDAIIVGKTNMDEFAFGPNQHWFGRTNCPADPERYAGGSSAGSAAAVASGCVPLALGTDAGGSVRYPAACCGVLGFKPTFGWVQLDEPPPHFPSLDHVGLLGTSAKDLAILARALRPEFPDLPDLPDTLRVGVPAGWEPDCSAAVRVAVSTALADLKQAGADLLECAAVDNATQTFEALLATVTAEAACSLGDVLAASGPESISPPVRSLLDAGRAVPAVEYLNAQRYRAMLRAHVDALLEKCDLLALPAVARPALRWDDPQLNDWSIARFFPAFNLTGHPAITIPLPVNGLPLGLQLVGRRNADVFILAAADWIQAELTTVTDSPG